ncbi:unnamed protein product [Bursaphelenchus okinawaensis]|uniref:Uncharacterized protein n=1 Tax=Bursaphelenchus okinawaensis TaxID=465554 RepID=A0A811KCC9_9BILA|nr:unnamed protein product [Bursaphelenchus okinawaensis]CAG9100861.1 unnamed protein product [Bursaphelenchus okinawaensis]
MTHEGLTIRGNQNSVKQAMEKEEYGLTKDGLVWRRLRKLAALSCPRVKNCVTFTTFKDSSTQPSNQRTNGTIQ